MYNFEALLMALQSAQRSHLMLIGAPIPVSIVVNDNLTNEPTFLENVDPKALILHWIQAVNPHFYVTLYYNGCPYISCLSKKSTISKKSSPSRFVTCIPGNTSTACPNESEVGGWFVQTKFPYSASTVESMTSIW